MINSELWHSIAIGLQSRILAFTRVCVRSSGAKDRSDQRESSFAGLPGRGRFTCRRGVAFLFYDRVADATAFAACSDM